MDNKLIAQFIAISLLFKWVNSCIIIYLNSSSQILAAILTGINIFGLKSPHKEGLLIFLEYDNSTSALIFISFMHFFKISLCLSFIFFIEALTIFFNFLYPIPNTPIDNATPNIQIKQ